MQALIRDTQKARKFADLATALQPLIDAKLHWRLENTPKRAKQAAEARNDGRHLKRTQAALYALSHALAAGTCPLIVATLTPN